MLEEDLLILVGHLSDVASHLSSLLGSAAAELEELGLEEKAESNRRAILAWRSLEGELRPLLGNRGN